MARSEHLPRRFRGLLDRATLRDDAMAGLVLGVESVPDGLAAGLLAGVNPVAGLYAYMVGSFSAALFTSAAFMAVQGTGAMAIIVADVGLTGREDPGRALFTLSMLTGAVMIVAGLLRLGSILRFVSHSVMVGFVTAVGINIVLGQLDNFTGYASEGGNRIVRAADLLLHLDHVDVSSVLVGMTTLVLIVALERTQLGAMGLVVAIVLGSLVGVVLDTSDSPVQMVRNIADVPRALPLPMLPVLQDVPFLLLPAVSLAFVGLVQGAGVSSGFPNPEGSAPDASTDFVAQGVGNVASGAFQGMPVGGSMSATSLVVAAGARSRRAVMFAGVVMAVVVLTLAGLVRYIAMPALAALLIVVGAGTVRPGRVLMVARTGTVQAAVMVVTLVLTLLIPMQYAVLVGVGLSVVMYVIRQSNQLMTRRLTFGADGRVRESAPPDVVPAEDVVVLQPYGSLFFASAATFEEQLPRVTAETHGAVVILRLRGTGDVGGTFIEVVRRYGRSLSRTGSRLMIVTDSARTREQLRATGVLAELGADNVRRGSEWQLEAVRRAHDDARARIASHRSDRERP